MTEVDRRITDPHYDAPFLTWYDGIFEAVFIALHPFVKIDGIDPAAASRPVLVVDRSSVPDERLTMDVVNKVYEEYREQFPINLPELQNMEKKIGTPVSWEDIKVACGFDSIRQIDTALLMTIMAIKQEYGSVDDAQHLQAYCFANQIFLIAGTKFGDQRRGMTVNVRVVFARLLLQLSSTLRFSVSREITRFEF